MSTARGVAQDVGRTFRLLNVEQRIAAIASILLIASTFGPFSFIEAAEIVTALAVLALLWVRAEGREFHLPFGDGTVIAAAGVWAALLIVARLFDRSLGQNLLALACAGLLVFAGLSERAKRPADDLPPENDARAREVDAARAASRSRRRARRKAVMERPSPKPPAPPTEATERLWHDPARPGPAPEPPLAPPEFELPGGEEPQEESVGGDQLSLEEDAADGDEPTRRLS